MSPSLHKLFDSLESQRLALLMLPKQVPAKRLNHHPDGKWSINQIIAHLIAVERLSLSYLQKKFNGIEEVEDSGWREEVKMGILMASQRMPGLKFKAPRIVVENTPSGHDLNSLQEQWGTLRQELKTFLDKIPPGLERRLIYKHVRAGRLNTVQALKFFREHVIHHTPQIKKLL